MSNFNLVKRRERGERGFCVYNVTFIHFSFFEIRHYNLLWLYKIGVS